jgi:hypothetical protein
MFHGTRNVTQNLLSMKQECQLLNLHEFKSSGLQGNSAPGSWDLQNVDCQIFAKSRVMAAPICIQNMRLCVCVCVCVAEVREPIGVPYHGSPTDVMG